MNEHSALPRCPVCSTPLSIRFEVAHRPEPTATTKPAPPAPVAHPIAPPRGLEPPRIVPPSDFPKPQVTAARRPPAPPLPPIRSAAPKPRRPRRRLSPQATLLSLGVLLLLAAGVTFLAVTWDSLPVSSQAAIMAFLALVALAGAVPASGHKLAGTAEALAILGCGLLAVDLYGARARVDPRDCHRRPDLCRAVVRTRCHDQPVDVPNRSQGGHVRSRHRDRRPASTHPGAVRSDRSGVVAPRSAGASRDHLALGNEGHHNCMGHGCDLRGSRLRHDPHHRLRQDLPWPAGPLLQGSRGRRVRYVLAPAGSVRHWGRRPGCDDRPPPATQGIPPDHLAACAG